MRLEFHDYARIIQGDLNSAKPDYAGDPDWALNCNKLFTTTDIQYRTAIANLHLLHHELVKGAQSGLAQLPMMGELVDIAQDFGQMLAEGWRGEPAILSRAGFERMINKIDANDPENHVEDIHGSIAEARKLIASYRDPIIKEVNDNGHPVLLAMNTAAAVLFRTALVPLGLSFIYETEANIGQTLATNPRDTRFALAIAGYYVLRDMDAGKSFIDAADHFMKMNDEVNAKGAGGRFPPSLFGVVAA